MPPTYYRGCWHVVSRGFLAEYRHEKRISSLARSSSATELYSPKAFLTHAALLGQGSPHCRKFPTAASRRSLGRVSVPVWPSALSGRLRIVALVGLYPANWLMRHRSIRQLSPKGHFNSTRMPSLSLCGLSSRFQLLSPSDGQVPHVLLTRSPLAALWQPVRLACIRHAASVHPEPGSNSPSLFDEKPLSALFFISFLSDAFLLSFQCSVSTLSLECFINIPLPRCFVNTFFLKLKNSYFSFLLFHLLKLFIS